MPKDPAFLFYSKDWIEGTADMLPQEKGVYIDLLAHQHQSGGLTTDTLRLAILTRLSHDEFLRIWDGYLKTKFAEIDGKFYNQKLADLTKERELYGKENRIRGIHGKFLKHRKLTKEDVEIIRKQFVVKDFIDVDDDNLSECIGEWYSEWYSERYGERPNFLENGNGVGNGNGNTKDNIIPTLDQVIQHFTEKGHREEADNFFNYYESNGWKVGKNPMKKWKSAAANWLSKNNPYRQKEEPRRKLKRLQ